MPRSSSWKFLLLLEESSRRIDLEESTHPGGVQKGGNRHASQGEHQVLTGYAWAASEAPSGKDVRVTRPMKNGFGIGVGSGAARLAAGVALQYPLSPHLGAGSSTGLCELKEESPCLCTSTTATSAGVKLKSLSRSASTAREPSRARSAAAPRFARS